VTILGRGIDETKVDGLTVESANSWQETLADGNASLSGASNATLNQQPILVDFTVVGETTNGGNSLLGQISLSGSAVLVSLAANAEHSLVDFSAVVVALLTGTCDSEPDTGRVPSTDTGDLAEASMGLAGEAGNTPTRNDASISVTTSSSTNIQAFSFAEHLGNVNFLLEKRAGEVNLGGNITATVNLDLKEVSNLLSELQLADLGVGQNTDNLAVLLDAIDFGFDILGLFSSLLGILGESLPLGSVPVLVESTTNVIRQVVGPNSSQGAKTIGGFDVANNSNNNHRGSLKNSDSFNGLLLVQL